MEDNSKVNSGDSSYLVITGSIPKTQKGLDNLGKAAQELANTSGETVSFGTREGHRGQAFPQEGAKRFTMSDLGNRHQQIFGGDGKFKGNKESDEPKSQGPEVSDPTTHLQ